MIASAEPGYDGKYGEASVYGGVQAREGRAMGDQRSPADRGADYTVWQKQAMLEARFPL